MQELKELVYFVDKHINKKKSAIDKNASSSKIWHLYEGILKHNWDSDEEAAAQLYAEEGHLSSAYRKLKMTLKQRLLELIFSIDTKATNTNDRQRAYLDCCKEWAASKILLGKNARLSGVELCEKILKEAIRFEFSDICRDICSVLRLHYGAMAGDSKRFEHYNDLYKQYNALCAVEDQTEELYTELTLHFVNSRSDKSKVQAQAAKYFQAVQANLAAYDSYRLHLYGRMIQMSVYASRSDQTGTLQVCNEAIQFFEAKQYHAAPPLLVFYYQKLICYILLKQDKEGKETVQKLQQFAEEGTFNWFKFQELHFTLLLHTAQYEEACRLFVTITQHKKFSLLPAHVSEIWRIYEAYLHYLYENNKLGTGADILPKFKLGKFLNQTPLFSKDKSGMNIAILSIQILFSLLQKAEGSAAEQIENIRKYCSRHLSQGSTARSYYFIKMLLQIPQGNFHKAAVIRRTDALLTKLKAITLDMSGQSFEIEIIPYEVLWQMALDSLDPLLRRRGAAAGSESK